jgi:Zn-dependent peptidase ImmA (M78 family)
MGSGRNRALVKPALLFWARKSAGFDIGGAARKLKVSESRVAAWEDGSAEPSLAQLRKMASAYKRPLAVFYLPDPPKGFTTLRDFRTAAKEHSQASSPNLEIEIRRAHQRREAALDLAETVGEEFTPFPVKAEIGSNYLDVAGHIRDVLGIPLATQFRWTEPYAALNSWKRAVEAAGVLVFQTESLPIDQARGFSLSLHPLPVIALNPKETPRGRVFTLFHELAHLALRTGGVCDLHDRPSSGEADRIEAFCNRVAGAALVPQSSMVDALAALGLEKETEWPDETLRLLADHYAVSSDVALRSLVLANRYSASRYAARHAAFQKAWDSKKRKPGPVPHFRRALGWSGHRFARMALAAYDRQRISSADLTEYLRVKVPEIDKIRTVLRQHDYTE